MSAEIDLRPRLPPHPPHTICTHVPYGRRSTRHAFCRFLAFSPPNIAPRHQLRDQLNRVTFQRNRIKAFYIYQWGVLNPII